MREWWCSHRTRRRSCSAKYICNTLYHPLALTYSITQLDTIVQQYNELQTNHRDR